MHNALIEPFLNSLKIRLRGLRAPLPQSGYVSVADESTKIVRPGVLGFPRKGERISWHAISLIGRQLFCWPHCRSLPHSVTYRAVRSQLRDSRRWAIRSSFALFLVLPNLLARSPSSFSEWPNSRSGAYAGFTE